MRWILELPASNLDDAHKQAIEPSQEAAIAFTRAESRDNLRATVFLWITPLPDARCISGCAARRALAAAALSPPAMAVSTFLMAVRMRERRAVLRSVRRSIWRMRLRAEAVFAMG